MNLDISTWKPFKIEDLFYIKKGKTLSLLNKELYAGDIPCVNGSANNNGIFASLSPNASEIGLSLQKAPCITVSRVGNAGYAHVQHYDFYIAEMISLSLIQYLLNIKGSICYKFPTTKASSDYIVPIAEAF